MIIKLNEIEEKYIEAKAQLNNVSQEQYVRAEIEAMHEIIFYKKKSAFFISGR
ncbi:MAG: hypothetical protein J5824_03950 [Lachnospiraceae bacterium]|nr:hypothetical protein [Lachnospiraceae bacterium]